MTDALLSELMEARRSRISSALVTVVDTRGSVPRETGSKMLVYNDGKTSGSIGGGKFESLVIRDALSQMRKKEPLLKTYPLHEGSTESFGAICGGESTIYIEPQVLSEAIFLVGAGHCAQAISKLAIECGLFVSVVDDRKDQLSSFPSQATIVSDVSPSKFIKRRRWRKDEALVIVSRHYDIDRDALAAALSVSGIGYIGMIGSVRKVHRVFTQLKKSGVSSKRLSTVYAPIGVDIDADAPAEIAVSVIAEVLAILRGRSGRSLGRKSP
jgi:xanthine dehydrogenase accessory factor